MQPDGSILFKNDQWNSITGGKAWGNNIFEMISSSSIPQFRSVLEQISSHPGNTAAINLELENPSGNSIIMPAEAFSYMENGQIKIMVMQVNKSEKDKLADRLFFSFENSNDVFYEFDILRKRYNYVSPACRELFGITPEQAMNTPPGSFEYMIHAEDYALVHNHFRTICKTPAHDRKNFFIRYRYFHSTQGLKWVIDRHTVFYDEQFQPCLIVGSIRDITASQLSQEKLQRDEKLFKGIIDNSPDLLLILDRQEKVRFVSSSVENIFGYKPDAIINMHPLQFMNKSAYDKMALALRELKQNSLPVTETEITLKNSKGNEVFTRARFVNYLNEPSAQSVLVVIQDITTQKKYDQQLKDSYANLQCIINNSDDPVWSMDTELKLIVFNQAFSDLIKMFFGFQPEKGQAIFDEIVARGYPDQTDCRNHFLSAMTGKKINFEKTYMHSSGEAIMYYTISPIFNAEGRITGASCIGKNITSIVKLNRTLTEQNEALIKANRELDRFVYSMSHDLRSPVASALGLVQIMELEAQDSGTIMHTSMLKKRLGRLDALIAGILDFIKQQKEPVKPEIIDLNWLIESLVESRGYKEEVPDMELVLNTRVDFPVITDLSKLTTVLENLISNAIKYRDNLKPRLKIIINAFSTSDETVIQVIDNGIGIADKHKEKIFDMFYRASSSVNGSGLGLYIVQENLRAMEGTIQVESKLNEGSVFTIRFKNHHP